MPSVLYLTTSLHVCSNMKFSLVETIRSKIDTNEPRGKCGRKLHPTDQAQVNWTGVYQMNLYTVKLYIFLKCNLH